MKRLITGLTVLCLLFARLSPAEADRLFADSTGRRIALPKTVARVAVTGAMAQIAVYALAPELLCGISNAWESEAFGIIAEEYLNLPVLGQVYGGKGNLNFETLLAAEADILIDVGEASSAVAEDMDRMTAKTGVPCVHIDMTLDTIPDAFRMLGELLDRKKEAEILAAYAQRILDRTMRIAENVEKKRALYIVGSDGLHVIARNSYHSAVIDLLCENVALVDIASAKGTGNEVDMEQILLWEPDTVIFAPDSIYASVEETEAWKEIPAIRNGNYLQVPDVPYNWMGFPPSTQRLLGMIWLAKQLYPQAANYDLFEETKTYFSLFFHCELTEKAYDSIMEKSLPHADR